MLRGSVEYACTCFPLPPLPYSTRAAHRSTLQPRRTHPHHTGTALPPLPLFLRALGPKPQPQTMNLPVLLD